MPQKRTASHPRDRRHPLRLTWAAWQVDSGYFTTLADALARFTPEEEHIAATLSYPTEPTPVSAIAEISAVEEPTTRRALQLLPTASSSSPGKVKKYAMSSSSRSARRACSIPSDTFWIISS